MCPCQYLFVQHLCLLVLALFQEATRQIVLRFRDIRIVWAQLLFVDFQCSLIIQLDLVVFALILTQQGQVIQLLCYVGMITAQHLFTNLEGALAEWFSVLVFATLSI